MTRLIGILSTYAVPILGAALVAAVVAWGVQTWRIGSLQSENGRLAAQINSVVRANQTNEQTIKALVTAAKANAEQFERAQQESKAASGRAAKLESRLAERADDDISAIQNTADPCGLSDMPDDTRMRLDPRRDRDGGSAGGSGAPGSNRPGTHPRADRT